MGFELDFNKTLIDKGPHHTIDLIFIYLLFPNSKLILSVRHPMDVCVSCFEQDFEPTQRNQTLITLDDITERYRQVFSLLEKYEKVLDLDILELKYEELVLDFDTQMKNVFSFIHHTPTDGFGRFYEHASNKFVQSSSRGQTNKPLYNSSINGWLKYRTHVEQYIPQLKYFIDKYGYNKNV